MVRRSASVVAGLLVSGYVNATSKEPAAEVPKYKAGPVDAGMTNTSSKRLGIVLSSLEGILESVQDTEKKETTNYESYVKWCDKDLTKTKDSQAQTTENLEQARVSVKEASASAVTLKHELINTKDEREEIKDTVDQATNLRDKDREQYESEAASNLQSIKQIDKAVNIVGDVHKHGGFLQSGHLQRVRLNEPGESKYVLGIMKAIKEKLQRNKKQMDTVEEQKEQQYTALYSTKKAHTESLNDDYAEKQVNLNEKKVDQAESKNDVRELSDEVEDLGKYLKRVETQCKEKKHEWQVKTQDRKNEKSALLEAITYVNQSQDGSSTSIKLVQVPYVERDLLIPSDDQALIEKVSMHRRIRSNIAALGAMPASDASGVLAGSLDTLHAQFLALQTSITNDQRQQGFDSAVKVIHDLVATLQKQQEDEDKKRKYCKKELESKEDEQSTTKDRIDALSASIEKKTTQVAIVDNEISLVKKTNGEAQENDKEAAELRSKEETAYNAATKDRKLAVRVLLQAKQVLQKFYDSKMQPASFVQTAHMAGQEPPPKTWTGTSQRHSVQSAGALAMLDKVAMDIEKEQTDAEKGEKLSKSEYRQYTFASKTAFDKRFDAMNVHVARRARSLVKLANDKEDLSSMEDDHESLGKQLTALHDGCDELLQHHEQRSKERGFEVSQLRDVVDILSGSTVAARTGLVQQQDASVPATSLQDQELTKILEADRMISALQVKARSL